MANIPFLNNAYFSSKVGIGIDSPGPKLEVISADTNTATFRNSIGQQTVTFGSAANTAYSDIILSTNGGTGEIFKAGTGYTSYGGVLSLNVYNSNGPIAFHPNGASGQNAMFIATNKNVGIGTTSPNAPLEVRASASSPFAALRLSTSSTKWWQLNTVFNNTNPDLFFAPNGGAATLTLQQDGDVGIGTINPSQKLQVHEATSSSASYAKFSNAQTGITTADGFDIGVNTGNEAIIWQRENSNILIGTSGTERMRINSAGNVGIGTTSPGSKLVVAGGTDTAYNDGTLKVVGSIALNAANNLNPALNRWALRPRAAGVEGSFDIFDARHSLSRLTIVNSGNIGIGTTSPLTKLHIAGTTDGNIIRIENTTTALSAGDTIGAIQFFNNDTTDDSPNVAASIYATAGASGGSGSLRFKTKEPGTEGDPATDTMIITNGGRVGIGTTSPGAKLNVDGDVLIKSGEYLSWGTVGQTAIEGSTASNKLNFLTNGSSQMFLNSTGLGIGTTSPQRKLDVYLGTNDAVASIGGTISAGEYAGLHFGYSEAGNSLYRHSAIVFERDDGAFGDARGKIHILNSPSGSASADLGDSRLTILPTGNVGIGITNPSTKLDVAGLLRIAESGNTAFYGGDYVRLFGAQAFRFLNSSGSAIAQISLTGNSYFNGGNVGIGTTSPSEKLYVASTAGFIATFQSTTATDFRPIRWVNSAGQNVGFLGNNGSTNEFSLIAQDRPLRFGTGSGGAERMRITSAGNVGIGTTSPTFGLTVYSDEGIQVKGKTGTINGSIRLIPASGGREYQLRNVSADFQIRDISADVVRMHFDNDGNTGIGTTTPGAKLEVRKGGTIAAQGDTDLIVQDSTAASSTSQVQILGGATGFSNLYFSDTSAYNVGGFIYNHSSNYLATNVNGSERMRIDSAGAIKFNAYGAGTLVSDASGNITVSSGGGAGGPFLPLTAGSGSPLSGNIHFSQTNSYIFGGDNEILAGQDASGYYLATGNGQNLTKPVFIGDNNASIRFSAGNSEKMRINANGNVGIGETNPTDPLTITSTSNSTGIRLNYPSTNSTVYPFYVGNAAETAYVRASSNAIAFKRNGGASTIKTEGSSNNLSLESTGNFIVKTGNPVDTRMTILTSGNVGIGTTSPSAKLEVNGGIKLADNSPLTWSTSSTRIFGQSGYMQFQVAGADSMRLTSTGKVGIGTINPTLGKLQVDGVSTTIAINSSTNTDSTLFMLRNGGANGIALLKVRDGGHLSFDTGANGAAQSEKMRILANGNIGIGTTSPSFKLHVDSDVASGDVCFIHHDNASQSSGTVMKIRSDAGDNAGSALLNIENNTGNALYVRGDRNVGIGTDSPDHILCLEDTEPTLRIFDTVNTLNNEQTISFGTEPGNRTHSEISGINLNAGNAEGGLIFKTNSGASLTEKMRIDGSGNVGIGTTSPSTKLDVAGDIKADTLIATDLTAGFVPYNKSGVGLDDSKIYTNGTSIAVGQTTFAAGCTITSLTDVSAAGYRLAAMQTAPAARNSTGTLGEIIIDGNHLYVCYATNSWSRVALETAW